MTNNTTLSPIQMLTGHEKKKKKENGGGTINVYLNNDYITEDEDDDDNWLVNETEEVPNKNRLKPLEEQVLSQKLSQLSTAHQPTEHLNILNEDLNENIPNYLSKESKSFKQVISHVSSNDMIEELRQMAVLIYRISMINLQKSLWNTYLKAGTGKLKSNERTDNNNNIIIGPQIWPIEVQQSMMKQSTNNIDNATCLTYVTQHLCELHNKMEQYQIKLNVKNNQLSDYLQIIETFVQQGLESVRLETEHKIACVQYNYNDHVLELEYFQHNPTSHQKQIVKQLNHAKYQEEITKEEYNFLKQRISIHQTSQTHELTEETFFKTIEDQHIRQKLQDQYINIAQQAKEDMIQLYLSSAKAQMDRYHKQFNGKLKQFWLEQRSLPNDKKNTEIMMNLIEQRWKNISESVKCVYKYKLDLLHLNSVNQ